MPTSSRQRALPEQLARAGATAFGLVLSALPVAMWVAWSPMVFVLVVATGAVSAAMLIVLIDRCGVESDRPSASASAGPHAVPPGEFVEELHRIFPLTYHHSLVGRSRFRHAMGRLRRLVP
jgi:hypothetical protein